LFQLGVVGVLEHGFDIATNQGKKKGYSWK